MLINHARRVSNVYIADEWPEDDLPKQQKRGGIVETPGYID